MDFKHVEKLVLIYLSENQSQEVDVRNVFQKYNIEMSTEDYAKFVGHHLIAKDYVQFGTEPSGFHFKPTDLAVKLGKEIVSEMAAGTETEEIELLPSLKPSAWPMLLKVLHEPLLAYESDDMPYVVYGKNTDIAHAPLPADSDIPLSEAKSLSLKNIQNCQVSVDEFNAGDFTILICSGGYYAAEKILDVTFMKNLQARFGTDMLAAGLPRKGCMFVTNALQSKEIIGKFSMFVSLKHNENEQTVPLSKTLFLLKDGVLSGVIDLVRDNTEKAEPEVNDEKSTQQQKPGFFKRLFGLN